MFIRLWGTGHACNFWEQPICQHAFKLQVHEQMMINTLLSPPTSSDTFCMCCKPLCLWSPVVTICQIISCVPIVIVWCFDHLPFFPFFNLWWKFQIHCTAIRSQVYSLLRHAAWPVTYIMQFLRVTHLSTCLQTPSSWTNDHCHITEASKKVRQLTAINLLTKTNNLFPPFLCMQLHISFYSYVPTSQNT